MRLSNLRIARKILALMLFMSSIAICIGAYGGWSIVSVNDNYARQTHDVIPARVALLRAAERINEAGHAAYKVMAYPAASDESKTAARETERLEQEALDLLDAAMQALPEEATLIQPLISQVSEIRRLIQEANILGLRDEDEKAKAALTQVDRQIANTNSEIGKLVDASLTQMRRSSADLTAQSNRTAIAMLLIAVLAAMGGTGVALWVTKTSISSPLEKLQTRMAALASGETEAAVEGEDRGDEIGAMARAVAVFRDAAVDKARLEAQAEEQRRQATATRADVEAERQRSADAQAAAAREQASAMEALARGLSQLAEGDLTVRLDDGFSAAYGKIREDFNLAAAKLQETIAAIALATAEVSSAAAEISASTMDLSQRTEEQAASLEETSASMEQMAATVKKNAENAQVANQSAIATREVAGRGGQVVANAVDAMARIEESSRKISDIIGVIDEIARQTNLLALNAAVEAARAGEAGRGFAVVASEVRSLAQRSSQAAKDIKELITSSNGQVKEGVELVNRAGGALAEIVESIRKVTEIVSDIASASAEQSVGIAEVNKALSQMDEATQQNSALVEENAATAKTLEQQAQGMNERMSFFHVAAAAAPAPRPIAAKPVAAKPGVAKPVAAAKPAIATKPASRQAKAAAPAPQRVPTARGPVGRMQAAVAKAFDEQEWEEF